jgi:hypothetical protein
MIKFLNCCINLFILRPYMYCAWGECPTCPTLVTAVGPYREPHHHVLLIYDSSIHSSVLQVLPVKSTRLYFPEGRHWHLHRSENLISHLKLLITQMVPPSCNFLFVRSNYSPRHTLLKYPQCLISRAAFETYDHKGIQFVWISSVVVRTTEALLYACLVLEYATCSTHVSE